VRNHVILEGIIDSNCRTWLDLSEFFWKQHFPVLWQTIFAYKDLYPENGNGWLLINCISCCWQSVVESTLTHAVCTRIDRKCTTVSGSEGSVWELKSQKQYASYRSIIRWIWLLGLDGHDPAHLSLSAKGFAARRSYSPSRGGFIVKLIIRDFSVPLF
jgi:hypothetical protein